MIITYIGLIISVILFAGCGISYGSYQKALKNSATTLDYLVMEAERENRLLALKKQKEIMEEQLQENRVFSLDFIISHGSAIGGCSAWNQDGRRKKGSIPLDSIMMFGKNEAGQSFTYYIEEENIEICATDDPDTLRVCSKGQPFEIRNSSESRGEGNLVQEAVIEKNQQYYIILDSKHEISILAKNCG